MTYKDNTAVMGTTYKYRIRAVNAGGESDYSNELTIMITGMEESTRDIIAYPNPAKNFIDIQSEELVRHATIFPLDGRVVETISPGSCEFRINTTGFASGFYLVQLETEKTRKTIKIIKQ